jgi:hypothetical protein
MAELEIEGVVEPIPTSASISWWRILAIALLPFGFVLVVKLAIRLCNDLIRLRQ